jgi:hypothetical protein
MRWVTLSFLVPLTVAGMTVTTVAAADDNCPPGSWFCESVEVDGSGVSVEVDDGDSADAEASGDDDLATNPDDSPTSSKQLTKGKKHKRHKKQKRVHVEDDGEDKTIEVAGDGDQTVVIVKKHKKGRKAVPADTTAALKLKKQRRWRERFGLNLRIEAAAFVPREGDEVRGMGGAGASFRWRPSPYFAFDLGGDIVGGSDYHGDDRVEFSGALSGILYFNPQHRVQVYGIGGLHLSHAEVERNSVMTDANWNTWEDQSEGRNYFGGHGGLGIEFRISRHFGMFLDGLAIIRTRIDSDEPEFHDPNTGESTNTSGAGLFRTGVNFWW